MTDGPGADASAAALSYYARHGPVTDPREHADLLEGLPTDITELCRVVQGNLLHVFWAQAYGETLSEERKREVNLRHVWKMLARIRARDGRPLVAARQLGERLVGNCRDFSTLLCAILRHQGVPARARCGFGTYFRPGHYEDHWVCEYWNANEGRWITVDPQLDAVQREALHIEFDPCDMPRDRFLVGGAAWNMCRAGRADPDLFGIFDMRGLWFIRGNLVRDFASLNRMELLPWDAWGLISVQDEDVSDADLALLDRAAALCVAADNAAFPEVRTLYEDEPGLRVPSMIVSYGSDGVRRVDMSS